VSASVLQRILDRKREEIASLKAATTLAELESSAREAPPPRDFIRALARRGAARPRVIAEFKRASPSAGTIREGANPAYIAAEYEQSGAAALSVLTDRDFFGGSLADLTTARMRVTVPVLRKDFIIDPWQVVEARAAAADAVLLIAKALSDAQLGELLAAAEAQGLGVLVEVHDADECARAVASGARAIGVNHRDLRSFTIDLELSARLRPLVPADRVYVAESGIRSRDDVRRLTELGVDALLVGESFMRQPSPGAALVELMA
jgi:indole-3-glycerol phosphate synthase